MPKVPGSYSLEELQQLGFLSDTECGAELHLARHTASARLCTIKSFTRVILHGRHPQREFDLMNELQNSSNTVPIIRLQGVIQASSALVFEHMPGGDLFTLMSQQGPDWCFLGIEHVVFYSATLVQVRLAAYHVPVPDR